MEITEQTILDLVKGQATVTQAVVDLSDRMDRAMPILVARNQALDAKDAELEKSIHGVEKKLWYFGGAGSVLGFIAEHFGVKYFGGK